jgi:proteasome lid subunit RPN8/RPN11
MIAKEGMVYERIDGEYFKGYAPTEKAPELGVKWVGPKIPYDTYLDAVRFFKAVLAEHKSEGIGLLFVRGREWQIAFPKQSGSIGGVDVDMTDEFNSTLIHSLLDDGWHKCGSIHSHPTFSAFQSGVDHKSESFTCPGPHITVGDLDKEKISLHCRIVFRQEHVEVHPSVVIDVPLCDLPHPKLAAPYNELMLLCPDAVVDERFKKMASACFDRPRKTTRELWCDESDLAKYWANNRGKGFNPPEDKPKKDKRKDGRSWIDKVFAKIVETWSFSSAVLALAEAEIQASPSNTVAADEIDKGIRSLDELYVQVFEAAEKANVKDEEAAGS